MWDLLSFVFLVVGSGTCVSHLRGYVNVLAAEQQLPLNVDLGNEEIAYPNALMFYCLRCGEIDDAIEITQRRAYRGIPNLLACLKTGELDRFLFSIF